MIKESLSIDRRNEGDSEQSSNREEEFKTLMKDGRKIIDTANEAVKQDGKLSDGGKVDASMFGDLPLGLSIRQPLMEASKGQQTLCDVYLDTTKKQ